MVILIRSIFLLIVGVGVEIIVFYICGVFLFFLTKLSGECFSDLIYVDLSMVSLILLRLLVTVLILLVSVKDVKFIIYEGYQFNLIFFLLLVLLFCFSVNNYFLFYIRFEFGVVPMFLLILYWGYSVNRLQAGLYMFLYTLITSLPFLFILLYLGFSSSHFFSLGFYYMGDSVIGW